MEGLAADEVDCDGDDGCEDDQETDQEGADEPGGLIFFFRGGLGDAEGIDEHASEITEQLHSYVYGTPSWLERRVETASMRLGGASILVVDCLG